MAPKDIRVSVGAAAALLILAGEFVHWRASNSWRRELDANLGCAVIVLGFPARRSGKLHPIQRWRVDMGVRTLRGAADGCLVMTGGATGNRVDSEAVVMARYAIEQKGVTEPEVHLEPNASNTRENVLFSLAMVEPFEQVAFVSDPMHAARARRYALEERPELAERLVRGSDYKFGERWWLKPPLMIYEALALLKGQMKRSAR